MPGSEAARETTAISGRRCCESYARLNPDGSWQRTFLASCLSSPVWSSRLCYLTWSLRATKFSRWYVQLRARVPRTFDSEFSLLPTPNTADWSMSSQETHRGKGTRKKLTWHVAHMWPTPHANASTGPGEHGEGGENLQTAVDRMLPTPTSSMMTEADMEQAKHAGNGGKRPSYQEARMLPTPDGLSGNQGQQGGEFRKAVAPGGQLNPEWVEWLQGFPIGWTDCEPSETQ